jgi:hypothetical protein
VSQPSISVSRTIIHVNLREGGSGDGRQPDLSGGLPRKPEPVGEQAQSAADLKLQVPASNKGFPPSSAPQPSSSTTTTCQRLQLNWLISRTMTCHAALHIRRIICNQLSPLCHRFGGSHLQGLDNFVRRLQHEVAQGGHGGMVGPLPGLWDHHEQHTDDLMLVCQLSWVVSIERHRHGCTGRWQHFQYPSQSLQQRACHSLIPSRCPVYSVRHLHFPKPPYVRYCLIVHFCRGSALQAKLQAKIAHC